VFWTWLWGPIGLLLSTPLTVCLVVLGRYLPQLTFLDVILGDEPVLEPSELLYQRLLVGDPEEATERAEEYLRENSLGRFYDDVAIPALAIAEQDRLEGRLSDDQRVRVADSAMVLIDNLAEWEETPEASSNAESDDQKVEEQSQTKIVEVVKFSGQVLLSARAHAVISMMSQRQCWQRFSNGAARKRESFPTTPCRPRGCARWISTNLQSSSSPT
jgi:hypothetical protein